ncbi:hypothetical protein Q1695_006910 [Nippostrongylus brasiliensis]|nr:hypothetical protein Q1695_006910 [Nippostrongylus brasiliensis]
MKKCSREKALMLMVKTNVPSVAKEMRRRDAGGGPDLVKKCSTSTPFNRARPLRARKFVAENKARQRWGRLRAASVSRAWLTTVFAVHHTTSARPSEPLL